MLPRRILLSLVLLCNGVAFADFEADESVHEKEKSLYRAIVGNVRSLGVGAAYYWAFGNFEGDYDYPGTFDTLSDKLKEENMIVDDNKAMLNYTHALAGSEYYIIGRNNGLSMNESFWLSFGSSLFWEWIVEYREAIAVNDQVMTPVGGFSIGEFRHQMYEYLVKSDRNGSILKKTFAGMVNPDLVFADTVDMMFGERNSFFFNWDEQGSSFDMVPDFRYSSTYDDLDEGHLNLLYAFHHPKTGASRGFSKLDMPYYVLMSGELGVSDNEKEDLRVLTELVYWALQHKSVAGFNQDRVNSTTIGLASAFEYSKVNYELRDHWHATTHILGLFAEQIFQIGDFSIKGDCIVYGNMSMLEPYALVPFEKERSRWFWQTESWKGGYVHTLGYSVHPSLELRLGSFELTAEYDYQTFDLLKGLDRDPDFVVNPLEVDEWIQEYRFSLGRSFELNGNGDELFIGLTHRINDGNSRLSDKQWARSSNRPGGSIREDGHRSATGVEVELRF